VDAALSPARKQEFLTQMKEGDGADARECLGVVDGLSATPCLVNQGNFDVDCRARWINPTSPFACICVIAFLHLR
jgi:hypothetical protein